MSRTASTTLDQVDVAILEGISHGLSNQRIARCENISVDTVKAHLKRIYRLFGVKTRTLAVLHALRHGVIS